VRSPFAKTCRLGHSAALGSSQVALWPYSWVSSTRSMKVCELMRYALLRTSEFELAAELPGLGPPLRLQSLNSPRMLMFSLLNRWKSLELCRGHDLVTKHGRTQTNVRCRDVLEPRRTVQTTTTKLMCCLLLLILVFNRLSNDSNYSNLLSLGRSIAQLAWFQNQLQLDCWLQGAT
jgi:hypothetical protein